MRRIPPRDEPPHRRPRRDLPRPEGPFERLLKQRPERDPAPLIIGGTIAFLALVIVAVFVFSSVLGSGGGNDNTGGGSSGGCAQIAPGVKGCLEAIPTLPPGLTAVSRYIEFEIDKAGTGADISQPLTDTVQDSTGLGFYTYQDNRWQRVLDVNITNDNSLCPCGQGEFQPLPSNLAILKVASQAYVVGASLPSGSTLNPSAGTLGIITPRDYTPVADGTVTGTPTSVPHDSGTLIIPTIVGSSEDTASVVNDILGDESLRASHVQQISNLVQNNNLDGIDLEYSSVDVNDTSQFTAFVQAVGSELHRNGKKLILTLPPPTAQRSAYDWQQLAQSVDYIKILPIADPVAYWQTMPDSLGRLSDLVDTHKVLLVVSPFAIEGSGDSTQPIGYLQAMVLASSATVREPTDPKDIKPGVEVDLVAKNLDQGEGASTLAWSDDALAVSFSLGGTEHNRIYIENSYSVGFKLELVQAYALGGLIVADGSGTSDVANIWPKVRELIDSATVTLRRPNDKMLQAVWQAPDGGTLNAPDGSTTATWTPQNAGDQRVILVVSDGDRRFGQAVTVGVGQGEATTTPTPLETFPPSETPAATESPTPTSSSAGALRVDVGKLAEGDDDGGTFSNGEIVSPGSEVTYLITIDNDGDVPVTVTSLIDDTYADISCTTDEGGDIIGAVLAPDDGDAADGPGSFDHGADEIQCTFKETAPADSGASVTDTITGTVEDEASNTASDHDDATITTS
ncbi:MAG TPA: glycosyl hydrolase family 18 protein [Dehalococcoidia bacterium]|jgi:hypothetical protein|nr:glycosyl hydrolase family 18 protein [Dehalococcoidia bacterium]